MLAPTHYSRIVAQKDAVVGEGTFGQNATVGSEGTHGEKAIAAEGRSCVPKEEAKPPRVTDWLQLISQE